MKKSILLLLSILISGITSCSYLPEEIDLLDGVQVEETASYISLQPNSGTSSKTGLLFYPGGLIDPHAYISMLQGFVIGGYKVVIVKVSANLAITNINKAEACKMVFPEVEQWVLGGHSLGGTVVCIDIYKNPSKYVGAVLMGSYPSDGTSLSDWNGAFLSLFGENDDLATPVIIEENKHLLPEGKIVERLMDMPSTPTQGQTIYHEILGGNHGQFGSYGMQGTDKSANITEIEQHTEVVNYLQSFFNANNW